jgi:hypothetical protein
MNQIWTDTEKEFIRQNAGILTDQQGADQLSRISGRDITVNAWRKQRQKLKLAKKPGRGICQLANDFEEQLKAMKQEAEELAR